MPKDGTPDLNPLQPGLPTGARLSEAIDKQLTAQFEMRPGPHKTAVKLGLSTRAPASPRSNISYLDTDRANFDNITWGDTIESVTAKRFAEQNSFTETAC